MEAKTSFVEAARFFRGAGDHESAVELAANVWRLWVLDGDVTGGRAFLGEVLDQRAGAARARALALYGDGLLALRQGARGESRRGNEAALEAARAAGDPEALALAHLGLSRVVFEDGDYERARALAVDAREHAASLRAAFGQAPLHMHAQSNRMLGDYERAAALFRDSLDLNRRVGDEGMVTVELHNLGHVEIHRGDVDAAERYFGELVERSGADDAYSRAMSWLNEAALAFARGRRDEARERLAECEAALADAGIEPASDDRFEIEWLRDQLEISD
jgi:ATP/maltotriose-dependent transcriptional regulator MalT